MNHRGRKRRLQSLRGLAATICCAVLPFTAGAQVLDEARDLQRRLQYDAARARIEASLSQLDGEPKAEAFLLLSELTTDHKESRRFLREAQQAAPGGETTRRADLELARLDFARGNYSSVRSRLEPHADNEARFLVGSSWVALEEPQRAATVLASLRTPAATLRHAWATRAAGDAAAALRALDPLAAGGDFRATALLWKAECEAQLGQTEAARATAATLLQRFPHAPEAILVEPTLAALRQSAPSTPEAVTARPPATETPGRPLILLQLGAFGTRANAQRMRDELPPELTPVRIDEVRQGTRTFFRVSIGPFESADVASAYARERLEPRKMEWRLVRPESP